MFLMMMTMMIMMTTCAITMTTIMMMTKFNTSVNTSMWRNKFLGVLQSLIQDLETGCLKLAVVKSFGVQICKGDHNILIFQP